MKHCCNAFSKAVKNKVIWKVNKNGYWRIDKKEAKYCLCITTCPFCSKLLVHKNDSLLKYYREGGSE